MDLAELVVAERDRAFRLALGITGDAETAADAVQETCLSVLSAPARAARVESPRAWFLSAVVHTARHLQKKAQLRREREREGAVERTQVESTPADRMAKEAACAMVGRALAGLEEDLRLPLALRYQEDLSYSEVAAVLRIPKSTAAARAEAALERLRSVLKAEGLTATSGAVVGWLGAGQLPAAPAALAAALEKIVAGQMAVKGAGAAAASAVAKGGIAMKVLVGVLAAGVLAGAAAVVNSVGAGFKPAPTALSAPPASAPAEGKPAPMNEFKGMQEREEVFEFTEKPKVTKDGDKWTITFASKGKCDATVSIVDKDGKVIRHLASGVLGVNAPWPFQQNSLSQKIEWDGLTDDFKKADSAGCKVRVGLGLQAQFDKSIAYDPYLLPPENDPSSYLVPHRGNMLVGTDSDGKYYVGTTARCSFTGQVFGKDGKYVRTFFPPPAAEVEKVMGGLGYKFGTTKWGDKVLIGGWFGPFAELPGHPRTPPAGAKAFKDLVEAYPTFAKVIKEQPGVGEVKMMPRPKEIQAAGVPGGGVATGMKWMHISVDRARDEVYAPSGGEARFIGKTGELDKTWNPDPKNGVGGWESSVGPDGFFYFRWGAKMTRMDHEGKHAPFSKENTVNVPGGQGWWTRVPSTFKATGLDAVHCGHLMLSMTHQCGLHIAPNGLVVAGIQYPDFEWGQKMGVQWDTKDKAASFVVVFDRDGKLVTGNAVGQTRNGTSVTMDRDGNVYAAISHALPVGQKTFEGSDVPVGAMKGCSGLVKFRGLGGKYPLNVGPGTKIGKGDELPGAVWAYGGITGAMAGCFCHQTRHDTDFWARSWIPSNQFYSVTVLDSNMNRIARIGRYGNVDDADPKCGKIHFSWLRAVAASDVALYAADHGNRRIVRAALSYAAEETVPVP